MQPSSSSKRPRGRTTEETKRMRRAEKLGLPYEPPPEPGPDPEPKEEPPPRRPEPEPEPELDPVQRAVQVAATADPKGGVLTGTAIDDLDLSGRQRELMEEWFDADVAHERYARARRGLVDEPEVPTDATNEEAMRLYEQVGLCGSRRAKEPSRCTQPAGFGTSHPGHGRCKYHFGNNTVANQKSGGYSKVRRLRIRQLYEEFRNNPDPLNMEGEVAMLRSLTLDYIERFDEDKESRELWLSAVKNRSARDKEVRAAAKLLLDMGAPKQIMDLSDAWRLLAECTKAIKRIEDVRAQNAISRQDLFRVLREMGRSVRRNNDIEKPEKRLKAIEREWERIAL